MFDKKYKCCYYDKDFATNSSLSRHKCVSIITSTENENPDEVDKN